MKYKRKTDAQLSKEFEKLYRKEPTKNELAQYRKYKESISLDFWIAEAEKRKKARKK